MKCNLLNWKVACILLFAISASIAAPTFATGHCNISASPMSFPPYDIFKGSPVQSQGEMIVICEQSLPFRVNISAGLNASGDFSRRQMLSSNGAYSLFYNLYLDGTYSRIWGDGSGFSDNYSGIGLGRSEVLRIYGRIPASQNVAADVYTDTVVITVEW